MSRRVGLRFIQSVGGRVPPAPPAPINLYTGASDYPGKIVKTDLSTFTKVSTLTLTTGEATYYLGIKDGFLYVALHYSDPGIVVKVDLSTFTEVGTLTFDVGEGYPRCMIIEGNYLYVGLDTEPGKIVKVDLTTFTKDSTLGLGAEEISLHSIAVSGDFLYVGTSNAGYAYAPKIVKVNLLTFTRVGAIIFSYPDDGPTILSLAVSGNYLYGSLGARFGQYPRIVKIDLSTFSEVDRLALPYGLDGSTALLTVNGNLLYGACEGTIFKVNLTTFTYISNIAKPTGWRYPCGLVIGGNYLYVGYENDAGTAWRISKVDLTTFTIIDNLDLAADEWLHTASLGTLQVIEFA